MNKNYKFLYWLIATLFLIQISSFLYFKQQPIPHKPTIEITETQNKTASKDKDIDQRDKESETAKTKISFDEKKLHETTKNGVVMITTKVFKTIKQKDDFFFSDSSISKGTGFIVDKQNGFIVTNHHVVGDSVMASYEIKFSDGTVKKAKLLYHDPLHDFAFLQIPSNSFPKNSVELKLIDRSPQYNEKIFAIGNTHGSEFSSYSGRIFDFYSSYGTFSQQSIEFSGLTSAGASGSPVFNKNGEVIALLYGGNLTSGAALNIKYVKNALVQLQNKQIPQRKNIGVIVQYQNFKENDGYILLPGDIQTQYQSLFPKAQNKILSVYTKISNKESSSQFKAGDVIWKVNGTIIGPQLQKFQEIIDISQKNLSFEIFRDGKLIKFEIKPYKINNDADEDYIEFADTRFFMLGEQEEFITGETQPGVYISITKSSSPFGACIKNSLFSSGTIVKISEINGQKIQSLNDLEKLIPTLINQEQFSIRYIDYMGQKSNDLSVKSVNQQERFVIAKYESKFDNPQRFKFNRNTLEWDSTKYKTK